MSVAVDDPIDLEPPAVVGAVVVDYNVGSLLGDCVASLQDEGITQIVVVENGDPGSSRRGLGALDASVQIVSTGSNIGFGAGVNRGVAALRPSCELVVVANPDAVAHRGAVETLRSTLDDHPSWAMVGPAVVTALGEIYPSVRRFPSPVDAVGHAVIGLVTPNNHFTRRYRSVGTRPDGGVDWVSGAFFMIRRSVFESVGGFDEGYFMFAEDMDLCWRIHEAGGGVGVAPDAMVTHVEGVARRAHPYRMIVAHHRSAFRFAVQTTRGPARLLLPIAGVILGLRCAVSMLELIARGAR